MARICVIGGGPAGSVFAARMAQLGHGVDLVERAAFPRPSLGESLSPGVLPLLEMIGARAAVEAAGFRPVRRVAAAWEGPLRWRADPEARGLIVDRGRFDAILLARAAALGARALQPAQVVARARRPGGGWRLTVATADGPRRIEADLLAEAGGRRAAVGRRPTGRPTLALYAYWPGAGLPADPCIEAGADAWFWGVPLPDGTCNALAFVDARAFAARRGASLETRFRDLLGGSALLAGVADRAPLGPVRAIDATPHLAADPVGPDRIALGDAALALDPISSSGVQKAIQSALTAAVVANTLLREPGSTETAMAFYRDSLGQSSERHRLWAAGHYAAAAARRPSGFWRLRAAEAPGEAEAGGEATPPPSEPAVEAAVAGRPVEVSGRLALVEQPCIEGDRIVLRRALRHPGLSGPVAYLGGHALAPLIGAVRPGATPVEIAGGWTARIAMPPAEALAVAMWLVRAGVLIERGRAAAGG